MKNAHYALGGAGYSRTDVRITKDGELFAIETNTDTADEFVDDLNLDDEDGQGDGIYTVKEILEDTVIVDGNRAS